MDATTARQEAEKILAELRRYQDQAVFAPQPRPSSPGAGRCRLDLRRVGGGRRGHGAYPRALRCWSRRPGHDRQREQPRARRADPRHLGARRLVGGGESAPLRAARRRHCRASWVGNARRRAAKSRNSTIVDALPAAAAGKILKHRLADAGRDRVIGQYRRLAWSTGMLRLR